MKKAIVPFLCAIMFSIAIYSQNDPCCNNISVSGPSNPCPNTEVSYYSTPSCLYSTQYEWKISGGEYTINSSESEQLDIEFEDENTSYTVWQERSGLGCMTSYSNYKSVTTVNLPSAPNTPSGEQHPSYGTEYTYTTNTVTGATSYQWDIDYSQGSGSYSGSSSTNSIDLRFFEHGGYFTIRVRAYNSTCAYYSEWSSGFNVYL